MVQWLRLQASSAGGMGKGSAHSEGWGSAWLLAQCSQQSQAHSLYTQ